MKIKVCGMRDKENLQSLAELPVDYVGFIFYEKSKRFVEENLEAIELDKKKRVGVFVNELLEVVINKIKTHQLQVVQLHGNEDRNYCMDLLLYLSAFSIETNVEIIKAFSIDENFDWEMTKEFEPVCDYFLFDTKGKLPGGNGYSFDWELLKNYKGTTPFFLSGGITPNHAKTIKSLNINNLYAIDLNSGFEVKPALKDISLLKKFIQDVTT